MITNLLATITVMFVTNVTERVPMHFAYQTLPVVPSQDWQVIPNATGAMVPDLDPKQKWIHTIVKEQRLLKLNVEGKHFTELLHERIVSDNEVELKLERKESWVPQQTNSLMALYGTNFVAVTNFNYIYIERGKPK